MALIIIAFGALTAIVGVLMVIKPAVVFGRLRGHTDNVSLHIAAVAVRAVLGGSMLAVADVSSYPLAIEIIGWLALAAALVLALIGRDRFKRLMRWAMSLPDSLARAGGILVVTFGLFLVHAFT